MKIQKKEVDNIKNIEDVKEKLNLQEYLSVLYSEDFSKILNAESAKVMKNPEFDDAVKYNYGFISRFFLKIIFHDAYRAGFIKGFKQGTYAMEVDFIKESQNK